MCGIAGYVGKFGPKMTIYKKPVLPWNIVALTEDFFAVTNNQYVALIHRRLAIIDLKTRSSQPFHYNDSVLE